MAPRVRHAKVSAKIAGSDVDVIYGPDWNQDHVITGLENVQNVDSTNASTITSGTLSGARLPDPTSTTKGGVKSVALATNQFLTSIGTDGIPTQAQPSFTNVSGTVVIGQGGTGQATAGAAFDALAPTNTQGDIIFRNATTNARLAAGTVGQLLQANGAGTDPTWVTATKAQVGLSNVDNTSDVNKPVSTAQAVADAVVAANAANASNLTSGTVAVTRGGTGTSTSTGTGSVVLSSSPTLAAPLFTGTVLLNGSTFATNVSNYTKIYNSVGGQAIAMGGDVSDPTNYHFNTYHNFMNLAGNVTFFSINSSGGSFIGPVSVTGVSTGIEIGSTVSTNTPFVDFHSSANANDYDARIIASGGSATVGTGTLAFQCGALTGPTPSNGDNSTKLATTAYVLANGGSSFLQAGTGAVTRTMQNKGRELINAWDFGAVGNGIADDTNAIQLAINYAGSLGGAQVNLGPGSFKISSALWINASGVSLIGAGRNATYIRPSVTNQISILIGSNAPSTIQGVTIADLQIYPSVTPIDGAGIYVQGNNTNVWISGVIFQLTWHGITFDSFGAASQYHVHDCYFQTQPGNGLTLGTSSGLLQDVFVSNCIWGLCNRALVCTNVSGFWVNDCDLILNNAAIIFEPGVGQLVIFGFFNNVLADSTQGIGWYAPGGGGKVGGIMCSNCWAAASTTAGAAGIYLNSSTLDGFTWANGQVRANQRHGIQISGGKNITITGSQIFHNGGLTSNTFHGIIVTSGVTDVTIANNRIGGGGYDQLAGASNPQAYGIVLSSGSDHLVVTGNNTIGNISGGINDASGGVTKAITGNI